GPIVDETALIDVLRSGRLAGAASTALRSKPSRRPPRLAPSRTGSCSPPSPLCAIENVILSPHIGGATHEADLRLDALVSENLIRVLDGLPPVSVVHGVQVKATALGEGAAAGMAASPSMSELPGSTAHGGARPGRLVAQTEVEHVV